MTRPFRLLWRDGRLLRYGLVGLSMSTLDFAIYSFLVTVGLMPLAANAASTLMATTVSYFANRAFVVRSPKAASVKGFLSFAGATLFTSLLLQSAIIWATLHALKLASTSISAVGTAMVAKLIAMAIGALANYLAYSLIFKGRTSRDDTPRD